MCNALNLLSWAGLVPHGVCKPWQDSEESGKLESGWHMKSFLKCHCLWHEGWFQCLCLPSGPFSDRCSRWTSLTAFPTSMRPTLCQSRLPDDRGRRLCSYSQDSRHSCEWAAGISSPAEETAECSDLLLPWNQKNEKRELPSLPLSWHMSSSVLWAENHTELPGKMLQLGLEIHCTSGVVYVPQILQWPDWFK